MPDVVLDIVVRGNHVCTEPALPLEKDSETPPMSRQEQTAKTDNGTINTISTTRRNPVYGLESPAMENYSHIQKPPTVSPSARAPRSLLTTATFTSDDASQFQLFGNNLTLRAPQEISVTAGTGNLTHIMFSAVQGDAKSQVALGDMYREGRQVRQDYKAAMDCYSKAAEQGDAGGQCNVGYLYKVVLASQMTTSRQWSGITRPPTKATQKLSTLSVFSTVRVPASLKTFPKAWNGSARPRNS